MEKRLLEDFLQHSLKAAAFRIAELDQGKLEKDMNILLKALYLCGHEESARLRERPFESTVERITPLLWKQLGVDFWRNTCISYRVHAFYTDEGDLGFVMDTKKQTLQDWTIQDRTKAERCLPIIRRVTFQTKKKIWSSSSYTPPSVPRHFCSHQGHGIFSFRTWHPDSLIGSIFNMKTIKDNVEAVQVMGNLRTVDRYSKALFCDEHLTQMKNAHLTQMKNVPGGVQLVPFVRSLVRSLVVPFIMGLSRASTTLEPPCKRPKISTRLMARGRGE